MEETEGFSGVSWMALYTDLLTLAPSGHEHKGNTLKGIRGIQGGNEVSGIRANAGVQLPP